jgi:predicted Zn-dependent protease with MMP-like domain
VTPPDIRELPGHVPMHIEDYPAVEVMANCLVRVTNDRLREEIDITILYELGRHHGMTEVDLREMGYG